MLWRGWALVSPCACFLVISVAWGICMKAPRSSEEPDHELILLFCSSIPNLSQMAPGLSACYWRSRGTGLVGCRQWYISAPSKSLLGSCTVWPLHGMSREVMFCFLVFWIWKDGVIFSSMPGVSVMGMVQFWHNTSLQKWSTVWLGRTLGLDLMQLSVWYLWYWKSW